MYVAVIGQGAHHLAEHVTVRGVAEFAVVFALIWIAWINGTLYLELHGRQDGRTRSIVFVQMGILVLLAVFTADAADGSGRGFAVVYATFQVLQTGLWYSVWRQDRRDHPEYQAATGGYVVGIGVSTAVIGASAFLSATPRLLVWAGLGVAWIVGIVLAARSASVGLGLTPTDSLVERFGLFTIIVLGEVILGWWPACRWPSMTPRRSSPGCWHCGWASVLVDLLRSGGPPTAQPTAARCRTG